MTTLCIDELPRRLKERWGWPAGADHVPRPARPQLWSVRIGAGHVYTAGPVPPHCRDVCSLTTIAVPVVFPVRRSAAPGGSSDADCRAVDGRAG